ncbi:hypothetical protein MNBD_GAMMA09-350 [hydrothermal vent metagenome]|uniref:Membrane protein STY2112 n=1 Tax=hydrothermal vent metagenome TaxID=652676 RepID=A0A3B0YPE3_9ZZZZ
MTIAYWCVFITILLPYVWVAFARAPGFTLQKNRVPRIACDAYEGVQQRFYWAHLNGLEAIAPFSIAVIIAHNLQADQQSIDHLAMIFVGLRIAHALAYAADAGLLRSLLFTGGMVCMVAIFFSGI